MRFQPDLYPEVNSSGIYNLDALLQAPLQPRATNRRFPKGRRVREEERLAAETAGLVGSIGDFGRGLRLRSRRARQNEEMTARAAPPSARRRRARENPEFQAAIAEENARIEAENAATAEAAAMAAPAPALAAPAAAVQNARMNALANMLSRTHIDTRTPVANGQNLFTRNAARRGVPGYHFSEGGGRRTRRRSRG